MRNRIIQNIVFILIAICSIVAILLMKNGTINLGWLFFIPYVLVFVCTWLFLALNMLRNGMKNLYEVPTLKRIEIFTKLLNRTFAVGTFIKKDSLIDVYYHIINMQQISYKTKVKLYEAFEKKCITVPYPALPKKQVAD